MRYEWPDLSICRVACPQKSIFPFFWRRKLDVREKADNMRCNIEDVIKCVEVPPVTSPITGTWVEYPSSGTHYHRKDVIWSKNFRSGLRGRVFLGEFVEILVSVWSILLFNKRVKKTGRKFFGSGLKIEEKSAVRLRPFPCSTFVRPLEDARATAKKDRVWHVGYSFSLLLRSSNTLSYFLLPYSLVGFYKSYRTFCTTVLLYQHLFVKRGKTWSSCDQISVTLWRQISAARDLGMAVEHKGDTQVAKIDFYLQISNKSN